MKKFAAIFCSIVLLLHSISFSRGYLRTENSKITDDNGEFTLRAMGLGGWMLQEGYMLQTESFANTQHEIRAKIEALIGEEKTDLFYGSWLANHCRKTDIDSLASWGFNAVRLPMHYNLFTLPIEDEPVKGIYTWLQTGFELTDDLLLWCRENEMYLILDLHAAPGGQGKDAAISDYDPSKPSLWESSENRSKTVALWRKLAERYADEPWIGGYDLINETNWELPNNILLKQLYQKITEAIRGVDRNHIIFIEGNWWANDFTGLTPPWDDNLVYSFHKYWSYSDKGSIQWMLNIRNQYNMPIWCGEAGENSNVWFTDTIALLENNDIGWAWWPLKKVESISAPLSIEKPDGYQSLLDYWDGSASRPSAAFAEKALMDLVENLQLEKCTFHKDVVDAMIRQVQTDKTEPFVYHRIPGLVFATDYDLGENGRAYLDTEVANYQVSTGTWTGWNNGWSYRNDGVDIELCEDTKSSNGYNVGWTEKGEWLNFTVSAETTGLYNVICRVASSEGTGEFHLELDETKISDLTSVKNTGGWQNWADIVVGDILIEKGGHVVKFFVDEGSFNLNYVEFGDPVPVNGDEQGESPTSYTLSQNFPNPFNSSTAIRFTLPTSTFVSLKIYNLRGERVATIVEEQRPEGVYEEEWNAENQSSGLYFCRLQAGEFSRIKKMILQR